MFFLACSLLAGMQDLPFSYICLAVWDDTVHNTLDEDPCTMQPLGFDAGWHI